MFVQDEIAALEAELSALLDWAKVPDTLRAELVRRLLALKSKADKVVSSGGWGRHLTRHRWDDPPQTRSAGYEGSMQCAPLRTAGTAA